MERLTSRFPIYSRLLRLYPTDYQHQYREQMLLMLADMLDDPEQTKAAVWLRTILDFPISVSKQQLIYTGAAMTHENPNYMKRNTLLGALLLVPFPLAILVNSLTQHTLPVARNGERLLYLSAFIALPALAFLLCAATWLYWLLNQRHTRASIWKRLLDVRHNGLVLAVAGLGLVMALFVPFHDSAHCVTASPVHAIAHVHQTWRCIQQSR